MSVTGPPGARMAWFGCVTPTEVPFIDATSALLMKSSISCVWPIQVFAPVGFPGACANAGTTRHVIAAASVTDAFNELRVLTMAETPLGAPEIGGGILKPAQVYVRELAHSGPSELTQPRPSELTRPGPSELTRPGSSERTRPGPPELT